MNTLFKAMSNNAVTTNGMPTFATSMDANVDFFSQAAAMRGKSAVTLFAKALREDTELAIRNLLWLRDARKGAGERKQFRVLLAYLATYTQYDDVVEAILHKIPELGRFDDLGAVMGTKFEDTAIQILSDAIFAEQNALAAKWTPRKGDIFNALRKMHKLTPKGLRKVLVALSDTVEQKMCAGEWYKIAFEHVPSVAAGRYQRAFSRNAETQYAKYKEKLVKGEAKINASAVYPYNVLQSLRNGDTVVSSAQWKALPDYFEGSTENVLAMVDVSGSMGSPAGGNANVTCMDVAISLGLYCAERTRGVFRDTFLTFSSKPAVVTLSGNLAARYSTMSRADWGMSTDLIKAFTLMLDTAVGAKIPAEDMPSTLLIMSDMQFNECTTYDRTSAYSGGAKAIIDAKYANAGYKIPKIVFWNLNAKAGQSPATAEQKDVALVSGFSPSLMASILKGDDFTPRGIMLTTLMNDRYTL